MTEWRKIPGYDGYEISEEGVVRSFRKRFPNRGIDEDLPRILKPKGKAVHLYGANGNDTLPIHRVMTLVGFDLPEGTRVHKLREKEEGCYKFDRDEYRKIMMKPRKRE